MPLDVYFVENIQNVILAVEYGSGQTALVVHNSIKMAKVHNVPLETMIDNDLTMYRRGYRDALRAVGLAFGIMPRMGGEVIEGER